MLEHPVDASLDEPGDGHAHEIGGHEGDNTDDQQTPVTDDQEFNLGIIAENGLAPVHTLKHTGRNVHGTSDESPLVEDATDTLFIHLATDGTTKTIISGDSHLLKLEQFKEIVIIKKADFLKKR